MGRLQFFFLSALLTIASSSYAQQEKENPNDYLNELTVDRPGIAESPFTVAPKTYQLESGFEYYNKSGKDIFLTPVSLFRTGISQAAELRIAAKNIFEKQSGDKVLKGLSPITVGIKAHIINQKNWIPETDILAEVVIPVGNSVFQPDFTGHNVLLLFQNDFSNQSALNYNVGFLWDGLSNKEMFTSSFCYNYLVSKKIGLFAEYFNFIRQNSVREHGFDSGATLLVGEHFQLDLSAGISRTGEAWNFFLASGISVRFQRK